MNCVIAAEPPVRWAGGKRQLLPVLLANLPPGWCDFHEPFVGGGAMFFGLLAQGWTSSDRATLNDSSPHTIGLFRALRDDLVGVMVHLYELAERSDLSAFLAARTEFNRGAIPLDGQALRYAPEAPEPSRAAALMLYLNRLCFNGLFRLNRRGEFNVPYGQEEKTVEQIVRLDDMLAVSRALQGVELLQGDFDMALERVEPGDLVYLDPPYWPRNSTAKFTGYAGAFGPAEHVRLAQVCRRLDRMGVGFLQSNAAVGPVLELYQGFRVKELKARRNINAKGGKRGPVGELLISNY
jgi:DNA adenine methylase